MGSADLSARSMGLVALLAVLAAVVSAGATGGERTLRGRAAKMGAGTLQSFVTLDPGGAPRAIGVTLSAGALEQLPPSPNTTSRCFDMDGDGRHTGHECIGDLERILDVPVPRRPGSRSNGSRSTGTPPAIPRRITGPISTFTSTPQTGS